MSEVMFKPIRGLEADLERIAHTEGALLIATDTGKMWMDTPSSRVALGGSGASLLYASAIATEFADPDDGSFRYSISRSDLDNEGFKPQVDDLILNSDGSFYRILNVEDEDILICSRLAVSGTGTGGGGGAIAHTKAMTIKGYPLSTTNLVNGQKMEASFLAKSALDENGEIADTELTISWSLSVTSTGTVYDSGTFKIDADIEKSFEFGSRLRESTGSTLSIYATGVNSGKSRTITWEVTTVELLLYESEKFKNISAQSASNLVLYCNISGNIEKILDYYIDGELVGSKILGRGITGEQSLQVSNVSHGAHKVTIDLHQSINGERGTGIKKPLEFEIAVYDGVNNDPIIWIGDYSEEYYNYDAIKIPYRVYNPAATNTEVTFVKGITELETRTEVSGATDFSIWQITDAEKDILNTYTIRATKTILAEDADTKYVSRDITFSVVQDPNRDLSLTTPERMMLKFDAAGRSNSVSETARQTWTYQDKINNKTYVGKFDNFNWYNNGWKLDENNDSMLRISNGASFSIPIGNMVLNDSAQSNNQSRTFEFEFKVRNVQDYSNLIKEYTRYGNDDEYWTAFVAQIKDENSLDNYDNFLRKICLEKNIDYDSVTEKFAGITRMVQGDNAFCSYRDSNGRGFALGPQDGFFSTAGTTLNVKYVEDKLINLTIVFNYDDKRIYMYLQGVLTAVATISDTSVVEINADSIVFNSKYCDVDLYKFRVYTQALSVRDVLINYAVDHTSVLDYDHTVQLLSYNQDTGEYQFDYESVIAWNEDTDHIDSLLMPYVVFETPTGSMLPYSKADKKIVGMTFVNTMLDRYHRNGKLEELGNAMSAGQKAVADSEGLTYAQYYYKHHCPSFKSIKNTVNLAVQGTSSEFYPRRNYKAKTKDGDGVIQMYMDRGPFAELFQKGIAGDTAALEKCHLDFFYYNNYTVGTTKFTMKIDYMESSGTYNMGLANLVNSAYTKHPLDDYNEAKAFTKVSYVTATDMEPNSNMTYYLDAKGKNKASIDNGYVIMDVKEDKFTEKTYYIKSEDGQFNIAQTFDVEATYYVPYTAGSLFKPSYVDYTFKNTEEYRTNVQGFPVMAFWLCNDKYQFIGRYNMLSDKGSDEVYGFKPDKTIAQKYSKTKKGVQGVVSKLAECWEYSDNARGFCSFRDPLGRHKLNFDVYKYDENGNKVRTLNAKGSCPIVADSYEYRYNNNDDFLDYAYNPEDNAKLYTDLVKDYGTETLQKGSKAMGDEMLSIYANWEKANQWVWSTCLENVPTAAEAEAGAEVRPIMKYVSASGELYDENITYYDENEDILENPKRSNDGVLGENIFVGEPYTVKYDNDPTTYAYDTREYRMAKFKNELQDHFDLEYCLVYFIITEVLMCYDSRGKNCMMASWGPKKPGGDYIWYPIFYDMDTQLGINNTGIPSFDYSENATIDGTFSTSDSILWNNLFTVYRSLIEGKYKELRNTITSGRNMGKGTFYDVDHIEKWYLADPEETGEIEMMGDRPLAMFNMDEFFKYISITNPKIGYQHQDGSIKTNTDQFFYALQGDRSLSRQQFLARRLNFIDSWFSQGNYGRGEGTYIWTRAGANNPDLYSDKWISDKAALNNENGNKFIYSSYYQTDEKGEIILNHDGSPKKTNYLDADFFINLTPYQKSYVTIGLDNDPYKSIEYEGKPVHYEFRETNKLGIMNSPLIKESLCYIYGANALSDMGDISRLYLSEFKAPDAPHILRFLLGNDHPEFYNKALGSPEFDAEGGRGKVGKPLLNEVNLSGIQFKNDGNKSFHFESAEKLRIFKALRSNVENVFFADGVALHTLYLPNTITSLKLTEANNLTKVINTLNFDGYNEDQSLSTYYSKYDENNDTWTVEPGLYIEGLTNLKEENLSASSSCQINSINLTGGKLGYGSYDILYKLYHIYRYGLGNNLDSSEIGQSELRISLTNVDWSPYKKLDADYVRDLEETYYTDNGHYGFKEYRFTTDKQWQIDLSNGEIYRFDKKESDNVSKIKNIQMLFDFIDRVQFKDILSTGVSVPIITGSIYVDNDEEIDEDNIRNKLLLKGNFDESKLDIHFKNVKKGYKARFIQLEVDGSYRILGTQVLPATTTETRFENPYDLYEAARDNYDFHGWSTSTSVEDVIEKGKWKSSSDIALSEDVYDYTYYALFTKHKFAIQFKAGSNSSEFKDVITSTAIKTDGTQVKGISVTYGDFIEEPKVIPYLDDSNLADEERYTFVGWTQDKMATIVKNRNAAKLININRVIATSDMIFYAVFIQEGVYDSVLEDKYLEYSAFSNTSLGTTGYQVAIKPEYTETIQGKITLPSFYNGEPIIKVGRQDEIFDNTSGKFQHKGAFLGCSNITGIFFLEDSEVQEFGVCAFRGCNDLKTIKYPKKLKSIGAYAFSVSSSNIKTNNLVDSAYQFINEIKKIERGAFVSRTSSVDMIKFGSNVNSIGSMIFSGRSTDTTYEEVVFGDPNNATLFGSNDSNAKGYLPAVSESSPVFNAVQVNKITIYVKDLAQQRRLEGEEENFFGKLFGQRKDIPQRNWIYLGDK